MSAASVTAAARIDDLVTRAKAETGLDDFAGDSWREGLEVLLNSALTDAHLNDLGEQMFYGSLVRPLVNRLRIEDWYAQVFLTSAWLPSYADWFLQCDMEPVYRYERRVLKLLQWKCPPNRWQLKSPTHTLFLDAFEKVFPEARFVMTHRDESLVLPSVADVYLILLQVGNDGIDPVLVGELNMAQWGAALDRVHAYRAAGRDDKFYDIGFSAFQADPIAEIRGLYAWLGREFTGDTEQRMQAWRAANPRDQHGGHEYDGADFGLTEDRLAERFGAYRARFDSFLH